MSRNVDAHLNGDCWPPLCPMCAIEDAQDPQCERCDAFVIEQHCTHGRELCEGCLHTCADCQADFAESLAYDDDRDEGF